MRSERPTTTTIKISQRNIRHIDENAKPEESVDSVLRRLLGMRNNGKRKAVREFSSMKTVKVSREVMNRIRNKAKPHESRDQTLSRLFCISGDDGNVTIPVPAL